MRVYLTIIVLFFVFTTADAFAAPKAPMPNLCQMAQSAWGTTARPYVGPLCKEKPAPVLDLCTIANSAWGMPAHPYSGPLCKNEQVASIKR